MAMPAFRSTERLFVSECGYFYIVNQMLNNVTHVTRKWFSRSFLALSFNLSFGNLVERAKKIQQSELCVCTVHYVRAWASILLNRQMV